MLKKLSCAICLFGMALGASADTSLASNTTQTTTGQVTFTGTVTGTACRIAVKGAADGNVSLGSVTVADLKNGSGSTPVEFALELQECTFANNGTTTAALVVSGSNDSTLLKNTHPYDANKAVGVGVEVTYAPGDTNNKKVINFSSAADDRTVNATFGSSDAWEFPFSARMTSVNTAGTDVKAGEVYAQMNVQMTYK